MVADYNAKNGTKYQMMPAANFSLLKNTSIIKKGSIYAEPCQLALKNLLAIQEGSTYVIPVTIASAGAPTIEAKLCSWKSLNLSLSIKYSTSPVENTYLSQWMKKLSLQALLMKL